MEHPHSQVRIGISACLLGERTRYDGGHKRDDLLVRTIGELVEWVPVCPEVEIGLGTPRETIRLVSGRGRRARLLGSRSAADHTASMRRLGRARSDELQRIGLAGYIFKKGSPSCGLFRVKVYDSAGVPRRIGRGTFAQEISDAMPLLPLEEEGRLCDPRLRENFFVRVFAFRRVMELFAGRWRPDDLVRFHAREKMLLMAHDRAAYAELGRVVAEIRRLGKKAAARRYGSTFMTGMARIATVRKQAKVLDLMARQLRSVLDAADRAELAGAIDRYRREHAPLLVPLTLIRHHVHKHDVASLAGQSALELDPRELMLRNHP
jgi:uncharacterized protein YbbK (DUF523 family)/uncharacterized protein YbgA (DUF1722 family)